MANSPEHSRRQPANDLASVELLPYLMNRLTSRINQLWLKELRPHGLTIPRWQVLSILTALDGSRMGELAEMAGTEQAVISRVVSQMQRDGLLKRKPARDDSRVVEVWISAKGRELFLQLLPSAQSHIQKITQSFDPGQSAALAEGLSQMLGDISADDISVDD
jgi:DNA-binding MarR family transcriptional regulator